MSSSQESAAVAAAVAAIVAEMNQLGGPMLIGVLLSSMCALELAHSPAFLKPSRFYGVTLLQTYIYYDKYGREDRQPLLWLVHRSLGHDPQHRSLVALFRCQFWESFDFLDHVLDLAGSDCVDRPDRFDGPVFLCLASLEITAKLIQLIVSKRNLIAPAVVVIYRHDLIGDSGGLRGSHSDSWGFRHPQSYTLNMDRLASLRRPMGADGLRSSPAVNGGEAAARQLQPLTAPLTAAARLLLQTTTHLNPDSQYPFL
ncbi:hypothetical protein FB45DRAFT_865094 [Roridomyces roridus]|uniref:Uncharacterized protein n=1 Tax=Roridomyces roridus TaxID=1738132 RepID=A0AAD7BYH6_9AGAR|nr:hypothetical protein FB45DRAFT_865094 [Roridomyces roridus]